MIWLAQSLIFYNAFHDVLFWSEVVVMAEENGQILYVSFVLFSLVSMSGSFKSFAYSPNQICGETINLLILNDTLLRHRKTPD